MRLKRALLGGGGETIEVRNIYTTSDAPKKKKYKTIFYRAFISCVCPINLISTLYDVSKNAAVLLYPVVLVELFNIHRNP